MKQLSRVNLTLFFTAGVSLDLWARMGTLYRELEFYHRLGKQLGRIDLLSYGGQADRQYRDDIGDLKLLSAGWRRRQELTFLEIMARHSHRLLRTDIIKTHQIRGAQVAVWAKKFYRKPLIVRCGFLHSVFTRHQNNDPYWIAEAERLERLAFRAADAGIVTSPWQRELVLREYGVPPEKIHVVPNYVITEAFRPLPDTEKQYDLLFIGRGSSQKNLAALFEAMSLLLTRGRKARLALAGSCCDDESVKRLVTDLGLSVEFLGPVPSEELPAVLNRARIFILPSLYEGHPKVLLEAMSCGLPCIGTQVEGIREELEHGRTGYLCESDPDSLAGAIDTVLADPELQLALGRAAREHVVEHFDIKRVLALETEIILKTVNA